MRYLLDSNVIIAGILGRSVSLLERFSECDHGDLVTSAVAYGEVAHGSVNGKPPPLELVRAFLQEVPVLPFDAAAADAYARLPFKRASYDRLIAAHALSLNLTVVTQNVRHYEDIAGLKSEDWLM